MLRVQTNRAPLEFLKPRRWARHMWIWGGTNPAMMAAARSQVPCHVHVFMYGISYLYWYLCMVSHMVSHICTGIYVWYLIFVLVLMYDYISYLYRHLCMVSHICTGIYVWYLIFVPAFLYLIFVLVFIYGISYLYWYLCMVYHICTGIYVWYLKFVLIFMYGISYLYWHNVWQSVLLCVLFSFVCFLVGWRGGGGGGGICFLFVSF